MASKANKNGRLSNNDSSFRPSSRRSNSFSSSSSPSQSSNSSLGSITFFHDDHNYSNSPIFSPTTPLRSSGIPFSWEKLPGIPKKQCSNKKDPCLVSLLPLPPSGNNTSIPSRKEISPKKYSTSESFRKDPFFAALVECSKDDEDNYWKESSSSSSSKTTTTLMSSISDRFGFINMYTSCKRTCAVSESLVYLPRSSTHYLYNRR